MILIFLVSKKLSKKVTTPLPCGGVWGGSIIVSYTPPHHAHRYQDLLPRCASQRGGRESS